MADPVETIMVREFIRALGRMVLAIDRGLALPARLSRFIYKKLGRRRVMWICGTIATAGAVALFRWLYDSGWLYDPGISKLDAKDRSEVIRNYGLVVAAFLAGILAVWRSVINQRQAHTAEQGQITDRYAKAAEMLSGKSARTRTAAVYALARIAQDSVKRDHIPVMEVLTEFIRNPPYQEEADRRAVDRPKALEIQEEDDPTHKVPPAIQCPDIHAALDVIAKRNDAQKDHERRAEFTPNFRAAALRELDLRLVDFTGAKLSFADFTGADLAGTKFPGAELRIANFSGTDLGGADFSGAKLDYAIFSGANIEHANFYNVIRLEQRQLAKCRPSAPPRILPGGLKWPFVQGRHAWDWELEK